MYCSEARGQLWPFSEFSRKHFCLYNEEKEYGLPFWSGKCTVCGWRSWLMLLEQTWAECPRLKGTNCVPKLWRFLAQKGMVSFDFPLSWSEKFSWKQDHQRSHTFQSTEDLLLRRLGAELSLAGGSGFEPARTIKWVTSKLQKLIWQCLNDVGCALFRRLPWMQALVARRRTLPRDSLSLKEKIKAFVGSFSLRPNQCTPNPDGGPYCTRVFGSILDSASLCVLQCFTPLLASREQH